MNTVQRELSCQNPLCPALPEPKTAENKVQSDLKMCFHRSFPGTSPSSYVHKQITCIKSRQASVFKVNFGMGKLQVLQAVS